MGLDPTSIPRQHPAAADQHLLQVIQIGKRPVPAGSSPVSRSTESPRTFLTTARVNGDGPEYGVKCGVNCPPGPGYWPIDAPEHPADMGWRNPTHQQAQLAMDTGLPDGMEVRVQSGADGRRVEIHAQADVDSEVVGELTIASGDAFALLELTGSDPASTGTSAEAYAYWLRIRTGDGTEGWIRAAVPSDRETGSDGRSSALDWPFLLVAAR